MWSKNDDIEFRWLMKIEEVIWRRKHWKTFWYYLCNTFNINSHIADNFMLVNVNKINKDKLPGSSFGYFLIYIFLLFHLFRLFLYSFASLKSEFLLPSINGINYIMCVLFFSTFFLCMWFSHQFQTSYFCCCWFFYMFYVLYASDGLLRCHEKCYRISSDCYYGNGMRMRRPE